MAPATIGRRILRAASGIAVVLSATTGADDRLAPSSGGARRSDDDVGGAQGGSAQRGCRWSARRSLPGLADISVPPVVYEQLGVSYRSPFGASRIVSVANGASAYE